MDLMLWRIRTRLISECLLETFLILGPIPDLNNLERLELCHALLRVFDEIMERTLFAPLNDMLLTTFMYKQDTFEWIENYSIQVLTSKEFETKVTTNYSSKFLEDLRVQVLAHFACCVQMIKKQFATTQAVGTTTKLELIQKLEFLIFPNSGIIQRNYCVSNFLPKLLKEILIRNPKLTTVRQPFPPKPTSQFLSFPLQREGVSEEKKTGGSSTRYWVKITVGFHKT